MKLSNKFVNPRLMNGESTWVLQQNIFPTPNTQSDAELEAQARGWAKAQGYDEVATERVVAIKRAGAAFRASGSASEATVSCLWDETRLLVTRHYNLVAGRSADSVTPDSALITGIDFISIARLTSQNGQRSFDYIKIVPRSDPSEHALVGNLCVRYVLSTLDWRSLFPDGSYTVKEYKGTLVATRLFKPTESMGGVGFEATFDKRSEHLVRFIVLAPNGGRYEDIQLDWGTVSGIEMPIKMVQQISRGDGVKIGTQIWSRTTYSMLGDSKKLDAVLVRDAQIVDCRFGAESCVNYTLTGNTLPSDEFVENLLKKSRPKRQSDQT